jgi:hypothetical protein
MNENLNNPYFNKKSEIVNPERIREEAEKRVEEKNKKREKLGLPKLGGRDSEEN